MAGTQIALTSGSYAFDANSQGSTSGEPVLLLHGFPESSWCWRHVQPALAAAGFSTLAPDQRGYSPRARPTDPADYAMSILVEDALGFADAMGWQKFHLVGHDWGGALAWQLAGRHPDRLRTLTVVSTPHPTAFWEAKAAGPGADGDDQAERSSYMDLFRQPGSEDFFLADDGAGFRGGMAAAGLDAESVDHYYARLGTPGAMVGALNWYRGADPADADGLGPITTPTLYVWSDQDVALGRTAAEATGSHVDGPYRFEVFEGVSHWIPEEAPQRLSELLVEHMGSA